MARVGEPLAGTRTDLRTIAVRPSSSIDGHDGAADTNIAPKSATTSDNAASAKCGWSTRSTTILGGGLSGEIQSLDEGRGKEGVVPVAAAPLARQRLFSWASWSLTFTSYT